MSSPIIITAVNTAKSVEANGQDIMICDKDREIEVKGSCGQLKINGMRNKIKAAQVSSLVIAGEDNTLETGTLGQAHIAGSNNQVTWENAASGNAPKFEEHGPGNRFTHKPGSGQPAASASPVKAQPNAAKPADAKPADEKTAANKPEPAKAPVSGSPQPIPGAAKPLSAPPSAPAGAPVKAPGAGPIKAPGTGAVAPSSGGPAKPAQPIPGKKIQKP
tara:strand:+ start:4427 stop:5080 length:654 start_codon:yes stop_codon:yes gene_type:complete